MIDCRKALTMNNKHASSLFAREWVRKFFVRAFVG